MLPALSASLSVPPLAVTLAGGWQYFLLAVAGLLVSLLSLYTRRGSGMDQHPYANRCADAPGSSTLSHDESAAPRYPRATR